MAKRYYVKDKNGWKDLLTVNENEMEKVIKLSELIYVPKDKIENIEEYKIEDKESNHYMNVKDSRKYLFLYNVYLNPDEILYLKSNGNITFKELDYIDKYILNLSEEEYKYYIENERYKELLEKIKNKLANSIVEKMRKEGFDSSYLKENLCYTYYNGYEWIDVILDDYKNNLLDFTEEFQGMRKIDSDSEKYDKGYYVLYELPNYYKNALIHISYQQGTAQEIRFVPKNIRNINEAQNFITKLEMVAVGR